MMIIKRSSSSQPSRAESRLHMELVEFQPDPRPNLCFEGINYDRNKVFTQTQETARFRIQDQDRYKAE